MEPPQFSQEDLRLKLMNAGILGDRARMVLDSKDEEVQLEVMTAGNPTAVNRAVIKYLKKNKAE